MTRIRDEAPRPALASRILPAGWEISTLLRSRLDQELADFSGQPLPTRVLLS